MIRNISSPEEIQRLPRWERELLTQCQFLVNPYAIKKHLMDGNVTMCSDGSAGKSSATYGYILSTNQGQRLVKGKGTAHGAFPNSFRSEAYGVLATTCLIQRLLHDCEYLPDCVVEHYLDNKSVIKRIETTQNSKYSRPNQKLQSEQDLIDEIVSILKALPIQVKLKWVKGHQDTTANYAVLPLPAQLNCDADSEAAKQDFIAYPHRQTVYPLPQTQCQLVIQDKSITSKIKRRVHFAAQSPKLFQYLTDKYGWDNHTITLIDWEIFSEILKKYKDQWTTIVKHLHEISPTGKIAHRNNPVLAHDCPACAEPFEDNTHVITCNHPSRRHWRTLTLNKFRQLQENLADPYLLDIIQDGLSRYHNKLAPVQTQYYPDKYHNLISIQNRIGWDQLYKGRWSIEWAHLHSEHTKNHPVSDAITGHDWVRLIGRYFIDRWLILWSLRNEQRHGADHESQKHIQKQQITAKLQTLYTYRNKVCPADQHIFYETAQIHIDNHPSLAHLADWINTHKNAIKASVEQAQRLGIQRNRRIYEYLTPNPSSHAAG